MLSVIAGHWRVVRVLSRPHTRVLIRNHPQLLYRYVRTNLARSFSKERRRDILTSHYQYLIDRVQKSFFERVLNESPVLWRKTIDGVTFAISLSFSGKYSYEGDLLLTFTADSEPLYHAAFTIVPGSFVGSEAAQAMVVARMQGVRGTQDAIRQASKNCHKIGLAHLLVAAAQGIALALDVGCIAGVRNHERLAIGDETEAQLLFDHDAFWESFIGETTGSFILLAVPVPEKPLASIDRRHRRGSIVKRGFKSELTAEIRSRFAAEFLNRPARVSNVLPLAMDMRLSAPI